MSGCGEQVTDIEQENWNLRGGENKMAKWIRLFDDQYLGFWVLGPLLFVLQEVPYMVMPLFKLESNPIMSMEESSLVFDIAEKILGTLCVAAMTFIVSGRTNTIAAAADERAIYGKFVLGLLLLNYAGWGLYFSGHQSVSVIMFFIVMLPPLYYLFIGLWRDNLVLVTVGIAFEIVHFSHVWMNLH
jgi:hypothetical protein